MLKVLVRTRFPGATRALAGSRGPMMVKASPREESAATDCSTRELVKAAPPGWAHCRQASPSPQAQAKSSASRSPPERWTSQSTVTSPAMATSGRPAEPVDSFMISPLSEQATPGNRATPSPYSNGTAHPSSGTSASLRSRGRAVRSPRLMGSRSASGNQPDDPTRHCRIRGCFWGLQRPSNAPTRPPAGNAHTTSHVPARKTKSKTCPSLVSELRLRNDKSHSRDAHMVSEGTAFSPQPLLDTHLRTDNPIVFTKPACLQAVSEHRKRSSNVQELQTH